MGSPEPQSRSAQRSRSPRRSRSPDRQRNRSRSPPPRRSPRLTSRERGGPDATRRGRSRSPVSQDKKPNYSKAFKWKSKGPRDDRDRQGDWNNRDRDRDFRPQRYGGRDERDRRRDYNDRDQGRNYDGGRDQRRGGWDDKVAEKFGDRRDGGRRNDESSRHRDNRPERSETKKPARPAAAPATFILVTVNDRLGTKATIPCLGSDTVGDFKKLVAAHIGRQPHEIMLKRQGERPFKDNITLEDYGVNNGVQLDLELDTGD